MKRKSCANSLRQGSAALYARFEDNVSGYVSVYVSGDWNLHCHQPDRKHVLNMLYDQRIRGIKLGAQNLGRWDTSLASALTELVRLAKERNLNVIREDSLPQGLYNLIETALAVPVHKAKNKKIDSGFLQKIGGYTLKTVEKSLDVISFIGEISQAFFRLVRGQAACSSKNIWLCIQEAGAYALPIVALVSLLVGLILAFVGVVQLRLFAAEIYASSLVAIGMTRIMGAIMTGIVLAGRTGAAYAATIGSMQVNEEVDALENLGIAPVDYLVLPRFIALTLMTPLLVLYSDFMGIIGGFIVGSLVLDIDALEYLTHTRRALKFSHIFVGLIHGLAFGIVVAIAGCYQGLRCGRSAEAVGRAVTAAVVNSIIFIIVVTSILTILFNIISI